MRNSQPGPGPHEDEKSTAMSEESEDFEDYDQAIQRQKKKLNMDGNPMIKKIYLTES
jgi:hypothetical protein